MTEKDFSSVTDAIGMPTKLQKGSELYKVGMLGIIISGEATVKRFNDIGMSTTIRTMFSGEIFGSASFFGNSCWREGMSSIIANKACEVIYIREDLFCEILKKYPQISLNYIAFLSDRIRFLNRKLDAFTAKSTEERLYEFLLSISDNDGLVTLNFGIAELARRLKVGRTSIYRDIQSLENKKLIERNGLNFKINK